MQVYFAVGERDVITRPPHGLSHETSGFQRGYLGFVRPFRKRDGRAGVGYLAIAWVMIPANHNERIGTPTANQGGAAEGV